MADDKAIGDKEEYNVSNPHPGFGKDPNIANEFGHTVFPKYVKNKDGAQVIVNNEDEEKTALEGIKEAVESHASKKAKDWK